MRPELRRFAKVVLPAAFVVGAVALFLRFGELADMAGYLRRVAWQGIVLALLCQAGNYLSAARAYRDLLATQGYRIRLYHLFKVVIVSTSLSYAVPTWGVSGNAFLLVTLRRNRVPAMKGAVVVLLSLVVHLVAVSLFLLGCLAYLVVDDRLTVVQTALLALALSAAVVLFLLWLWRLADPRRFARAAGWLAGWAREGLGRTFDRERIELASRQLAEGKRVVVRQRLRLADPVLYRCVFFLLDCATLWVLLRSIGVPADFGVATVGFTLGLVAGGLSLVPGGLGVTEVSMALVLDRLGVDFEAAVAATLLYRLLSFWLPMPVGLLLYRGVVREAGERRALPRRPPPPPPPLPPGLRATWWAWILLAAYPVVAAASWSLAGLTALLGVTEWHVRLGTFASLAGVLSAGAASSLAAMGLEGGKKGPAAAALVAHLAAAASLFLMVPGLD